MTEPHYKMKQHRALRDGSKQNRSDAVVAQRGVSESGLDDFPTPPWATRALLKHVIRLGPEDQSVIEPCCNRGYMSEVLAEHFPTVYSMDIHDYGYIDQCWTGDYLRTNTHSAADWAITNPPFKIAQQIAEKAIREMRRGVALLTRLSFLETIKRFSFFRHNPPSIVAQFSERVAMVEGRYDPTASTATAYAWLVWDKRVPPIGGNLYARSLDVQFPFGLIPPCHAELERLGDECLPTARAAESENLVNYRERFATRGN